MSKTTSNVHVLTANRLGDGAVVFLGEGAEWVTDSGGAAIARNGDEARSLEAQGVRDAALNLVVEPYLVEMRESPAGLFPVRQRERVRLAGPSMLADVPGYVPPTSVVRQAHHEVSKEGSPELVEELRPDEPVEGRPPARQAEAA